MRSPATRGPASGADPARALSRSLAQEALEVVERRLPALLMGALRVVIREALVGQDHLGGSVPAGLELHLAELVAFVTGVPVPGPLEDETLGGLDLKVLAAASEFLALGTAHDQPEPSADSRLDLGHGRFPVGAGGPPAFQELGAEPGIEDDLPRRVD